MTKYFALLKIFLKPIFSFRFFAKKPKEPGAKKEKGSIVVTIILLVCFVPMAFWMFVGMLFLGQNCAQENVDALLMLLLLACQGLVLFFGVPMVIVNIFSAKDGDRLLCLPVSGTTLFAAKLTTVYVGEVIASLLIMAVTVLPFGIGASLGAGFYLMLPIALILLPMLPLSLGCLIGFPLSALLRLIGNRTLVKVILQVVLFAAVMGAYIWFIYWMVGSANSEISAMPDDEFAIDFGQILSDLAKSVGPILQYVFPISFIAFAMNAANVGSFFLNAGGAILSNGVILAILILIALPTYRRTLSLALESGGGGVSKKQKTEFSTKQRGVVWQMVVTDFKRTVRDTQFGFQMLVGVIAMPFMFIIFGISFSAGGEQSIWELVGEPYRVIAPVVTLGLIMLMGGAMNVLGTYPFTRERQAFYILKTLPISLEKILQAKLLIALLSSIISGIVTTVFAVIFMKIEWYFAILIFVTSLIYQIGAMCISTYFDLKSPILDWTNFNTSLKSTKNAYFGMLIGGIFNIYTALVSVLMLLLYFALNNNVVLIIAMWILLVLGASVFTYVTYKILVKKSQVIFDNFE